MLSEELRNLFNEIGEKWDETYSKLCNEFGNTGDESFAQREQLLGMLHAYTEVQHMINLKREKHFHE